MEVEKYRETFDKIMESIVSSPSGLHYGHDEAARESKPIIYECLLWCGCPALGGHVVCIA